MPAARSALDGSTAARDARRLSTLLEVSQALSGTLNLKAGMQRVLQTLIRHHSVVRGMVTRAVESWCEKNAVDLVTPEILDSIRARMPTPKVFGERAGSTPPDGWCSLAWPWTVTRSAAVRGDSGFRTGAPRRRSTSRRTAHASSSSPKRTSRGRKAGPSSIPVHAERFERPLVISISRRFGHSFAMS